MGASQTSISRDSVTSMRVKFENVIKQGPLYKKGSILKLYNNECMFYLEKAQNFEGTEVGPYLKYGPKKKPISACLDLTQRALYVIRVAGSKTKLQLVTPELRLKLKAPNSQEREAWLECIARETRVQITNDVQVSFGGAGHDMSTTMDHGGAGQEEVEVKQKGKKAGGIAKIKLDQ
ncbi:hypothetical protein FGO68_gene13644 [Halteria grandinella]|uniref:PH domain-containing protein n=1 Tax=Halteria grandinella TaxID=5974 RepID=A0A8J8T7A1_HALGN|nr:hypothetical protein FGO68_gene13644 [Halteria grandinella]